MHELSIANDIVGELERIKDDQGLSKISRVELAIGWLMSVNEYALQEALQIITRDTFLEGTAFVLGIVKPEMKCNDCGERFHFGVMSCPKCGSLKKELVSGHELIITSIEAEVQKEQR